MSAAWGCRIRRSRGRRPAAEKGLRKKILPSSSQTLSAESSYGNVRKSHTQRKKWAPAAQTPSAGAMGMAGARPGVAVGARDGRGAWLLRAGVLLMPPEEKFPPRAPTTTLIP